MMGKTISHHRVIEKLGGGGMGVVYKAEDLRLKRTLMPVMLPNMSSSQASIRTAYDIACEATRESSSASWITNRSIASCSSASRLSSGRAAGSRYWLRSRTHNGSSDFIGSDGHRRRSVPKMIEKASALFPQSRFVVGDFFALPNESSSIAGILAFYCIVHLTPDQLLPAFAEMFRVLQRRRRAVAVLSCRIGGRPCGELSRYKRGARLYVLRAQQVKAALSDGGIRRD